jgi:ubiquinone/menaquinone biosynthesis C-methylase UbiE
VFVVTCKSYGWYKKNSGARQPLLPSQITADHLSTERVNMSREDRLKWIYSSKNNEELAQRYDDWAEDYDVELENGYGWQIPRLMAEELSHLAATSDRVLDAGAGTGLVGKYLAELGFNDLEALDLSREMLEKAREKGVCKEFYQMALGDTLDFPDDAFDAVTCAGVLTFSHAPAKSLYEMVRITRSGGHVLFSLRTDAFDTMGFGEIVGKLGSEGKWDLVDKKGHLSFPKKDQEVVHDIWVYRVN